MAQRWKERLDPAKHKDFMSGNQDAGGAPIPAGPDPIIPRWIFFVRVHGFTFSFTGLDQLAVARDFFSGKLRASDRGGNPPHEHFWQQWSKRLPASILKGNRRLDVVKALDQALASDFPEL
jgi:hypothetical protein